MTTYSARLKKKIVYNLIIISLLSSSLVDLIPCLVLPYNKEYQPDNDDIIHGSNTVMLYFHGNAEDLGHLTEFLDEFRDQLKVLDHLN
jgi:hypothetical protein